MDTIIKTENLRYSYNRQDDEEPTVVLSGLDLTLERGKFTAILGHNGSGKSTLAKHFNAVLLPLGGTVLVGGYDTKDAAHTIDIRRMVGMVFQNPDNQIVASVVEEDVAFAPENLGYPPDEIRRRVDSALRQVGMYEYREHAPHLLSGGQKQRIAIAGVLAMSPECVVFDEPTAMLDPRGRASVIEIIKQLRDEYSVTVVLITHHMEEAIDADRVIVLSDGEIVMDGTPEQVFTQVDELRRTGLDVPETVAILSDLKIAGLNVPLDAFTPEQCAEAICAALSPTHPIE